MEAFKLESLPIKADFSSKPKLWIPFPNFLIYYSLEKIVLRFCDAFDIIQPDFARGEIFKTLAILWIFSDPWKVASNFF